MLPLAGTSCLVFGCGVIDRAARVAIGRSTQKRLIVCVNRAAKLHGVVPDVTVWIDDNARTPRKFDSLCVYDKSVPGPQNPQGVGLPMWRTLPLPEWPSPGRLYHLTNTAAVAAVWALSVGCEMVGLVGCGCCLDGRPAHQMRAMQKARNSVLATYKDVRLIDDIPAWMAFKHESVGLRRIQYDPANRLREFYR